MNLLSFKQQQKDFQRIDLGDGIVLDGNNTIMMAGPCAVESRDQIMKSAEFMAELGIKIFRAGAFKPRTNPYAFQGAGSEGLKWLVEAREQYGLKIISEVKDMDNFDEISSAVDIVQIGAKAMYNHALLKSAGKIDKPVLIKRHFSATVEELLKMSDFTLLQGNKNVMLCERGIRTFESSTRFSLDLCGAAAMQEKSRLPVIIDPSHAIGYSYGVPKLALASAAFGCDGLLIEVHPNREEALCDKDQALSHEEFKELFIKLKDVTQAVGREII